MRQVEGKPFGLEPPVSGNQHRFQWRYVKKQRHLLAAAAAAQHGAAACASDLHHKQTKQSGSDEKTSLRRKCCCGHTRFQNRWVQLSFDPEWSMTRWKGLISGVSACTRLEKHHVNQTRHILRVNLLLLPVRWSPAPELTSMLLWVLLKICRIVIMGLSWTCDPDLIRALEPDLEHPKGHLCYDNLCWDFLFTSSSFTEAAATATRTQPITAGTLKMFTQMQIMGMMRKLRTQCLSVSAGPSRKRRAGVSPPPPSAGFS